MYYLRLTRDGEEKINEIKKFREMLVTEMTLISQAIYNGWQWWSMKGCIRLNMTSQV
jgi:hypothetical protein